MVGVSEANRTLVSMAFSWKRSNQVTDTPRRRFGFYRRSRGSQPDLSKVLHHSLLGCLTVTNCDAGQMNREKLRSHTSTFSSAAFSALGRALAPRLP